MLAIAANQLIVASWTLFPVAAHMMVMAGQCVAIVAPMPFGFGRISGFTSILNWIHLTVDGLDRQLHTTISSVHFLFAVLTDGHRYSFSVALFNLGISLPLLSVSNPDAAYVSSLSRVSVMSRLRMVSCPMRSRGLKVDSVFSMLSRSG